MVLAMPREPIVCGYVASEEQFPDKAVIIEEGASGRWIYVLLEGRAKVRKKSGGLMVTLYTLKPGAVFGEMGLFIGDDSLRTASVVADGPVRVGILDYDKVFKLYDALSPQLKGLIRSLFIRLRDTTDRVCLMVRELKDHQGPLAQT